MKNIVLKRLCFLFCIFFLSCSNNDVTPSFTEEKFFQDYIASAGFDGVLEFFIRDYSEFGFEFTPKVKGDLKELIIRLPIANSNLRVTIWDATTQSIVRTEIVNVANAYEEFTFNIDDLNLSKGVKYAITFNSNFVIYRYRKNHSNAIHPITIGNLTIDRNISSNPGTNQSYPTNISSAYNGDLHFTFQQTK